MKKVCVFLFMLLGLFSCSTQISEPIDVKTITFQEYVDETGFTLSYPEGYTLKQNYVGTNVMILSPLAGKGDVFQENFNVLVQDLSHNPMNLEEYSDVSVRGIQQLINDSKIIEEKSTTLAGKPAYQVMYTGKQGKTKLKWLQIWNVIDDTAYLLTYTAEEKNFDRYLGVVTHIIDSFSIPN